MTKSERAAFFMGAHHFNDSFALCGRAHYPKMRLTTR
jgi:hypothetical protein